MWRDILPRPVDLRSSVVTRASQLLSPVRGADRSLYESVGQLCWDQVPGAFGVRTVRLRGPVSASGARPQCERLVTSESLSAMLVACVVHAEDSPTARHHG